MAAPARCRTLRSAATNARALDGNTVPTGSRNSPRRSRFSIRWAAEEGQMSTWALVPIKPRGLCKTRLASVLPPDQRLRLVRSLLRHVLSTLRATPDIDRIVLVSSERDGVADDVGMVESGGQDLNASLQSGVDHAVAAGAAT